MIKGKGKITKVAGRAYSKELDEAIAKLPDGDEYMFVIADTKKNRNLPLYSYLFSAVLRNISLGLPGHPTPMALYKYFEDMFAPVHTSIINGEQFQYCDLKTEKACDVNDVIEKIVEYAHDEWGIEVPKMDELNKPENRELHSQIYLNQEVDWNSYISSRKKVSKENERRNKENERL